MMKEGRRGNWLEERKQHETIQERLKNRRGKGQQGNKELHKKWWKKNRKEGRKGKGYIIMERLNERGIKFKKYQRMKEKGNKSVK